MKKPTLFERIKDKYGRIKLFVFISWSFTKQAFPYAFDKKNTMVSFWIVGTNSQDMVNYFTKLFLDGQAFIEKQRQIDEERMRHVN